MADGAITNEKIADMTITRDKLAFDVNNNNNNIPEMAPKHLICNGTTYYRYMLRSPDRAEGAVIIYVGPWEAYARSPNTGVITGPAEGRMGQYVGIVRRYRNRTQRADNIKD